MDKQLVSSLNKSKIPSLKQFKHLSKVLTPQEKIGSRIAGALICLCLILLSVQGYYAMTIEVPKAGGEYIEGLIGSPRNINPILAQTNDVDLDLAGLIFSGLLKYDKNRQLVPDLADSYEISEDQLTYTFRLKQNVTWHDGQPFQANDVIFTVAAIQDPEFKSPLSRSFRGIIAEKVDDYTIKFILKEPFAPFLGLLTFGILPEHLWYNIPPANAVLTELNKKPVGTGAWQFDSLKKNKAGMIKSYSLKKNPNYYGQQPYINQLIFKFYGDFISAVEALKSKEVQAISYLPKEYKTELKKHKDIIYHELDQPQYTAIFFNQRENELLKTDYIRQALALAINKQALVDNIFERDGRIIDGPTLPGIETNPEITKYDYDPEQAASLLETNGWQMSATTTQDGLTQQIRQKKEWFLEIKLTIVDQPEYIELGQYIKQAWEQIGFKTELEIVDQNKIRQEVINNRKYQALLFGESLGTDPDPFPFWHSSQNEHPGLNIAIFSNKKVDEILEAARKTNDWQKRIEYYQEFQAIIAKELPAIFLFNLTYTYPQTQVVQGFDLPGIAVSADRFANLADWYLKTKRIFK